jgi:hypothetical protein
MFNHTEEKVMHLDGKKIIGLKDLNLDQNLPILGVILVTDDSSLNKDIKVDTNDNTLLTNEQVYKWIKHKEPKTKNALSSFMNRLRNLGLPSVKIDNSYKYKFKDLLEFLDKQKKL